MINNSNIVAIVKNDSENTINNDKVVLYDYKQQKQLTELHVNGAVLNIKLKRDRIFIVCEEKIYVFALGSFDNIDTISTCLNKRGIFSISKETQKLIIAFPDNPIGNVGLKNYEKLLVRSYHFTPINAGNSPTQRPLQELLKYGVIDWNFYKQDLSKILSMTSSDTDSPTISPKNPALCHISRKTKLNFISFAIALL